MMSLAALLLIALPGYLYLESRARKARREGRRFVEDPQFEEVTREGAPLPSWHWITGVIPPVVVFVVLNLLQWGIVVALLLAILTCCLLNFPQRRSILPAVSSGANGSLTAIMNTSCAVGFGSVVKIVPGFALLTQLLVGSGSSPLSLLVSEAAAVNVLAGATGSASGGLSIALDALGSQYLAMANAIGLDPAYLHRIASISAGGLDSLPHNGGILTVLAFSHCTHKESYRDILISLTLIPALFMLLSLIMIWRYPITKKMYHRILRALESPSDEDDFSHL